MTLGYVADDYGKQLVAIYLEMGAGSLHGEFLPTCPEAEQMRRSFIGRLPTFSSPKRRTCCCMFRAEAFGDETVYGSSDGFIGGTPEHVLQRC